MRWLYYNRSIKKFTQHSLCSRFLPRRHHLVPTTHLHVTPTPTQKPTGNRDLACLLWTDTQRKRKFRRLAQALHSCRGASTWLLGGADCTWSLYNTVFPEDSDAWVYGFMSQTEALLPWLSGPLCGNLPLTAMVFKRGFYCRVETGLHNFTSAGTGEPSTQANESIPAAAAATITVFDGGSCYCTGRVRSIFGKAMPKTLSD